jgi:hypothetical protein
MYFHRAHDIVSSNSSSTGTNKSYKPCCLFLLACPHWQLATLEPPHHTPQPTAAAASYGTQPAPDTHASNWLPLPPDHRLLPCTHAGGCMHAASQQPPAAAHSSCHPAARQRRRLAGSWCTCWWLGGASVGRGVGGALHRPRTEVRGPRSQAGEHWLCSQLLLAPSRPSRLPLTRSLPAGSGSAGESREKREKKILTASRAAGRHWHKGRGEQPGRLEQNRRGLHARRAYATACTARALLAHLPACVPPGVLMLLNNFNVATITTSIRAPLPAPVTDSHPVAQPAHGARSPVQSQTCWRAGAARWAAWAAGAAARRCSGCSSDGSAPGPLLVSAA